MPRLALGSIRTAFCALAAAALAAGTSAAAAADEPAFMFTESGLIRGVGTATMRIFRGVPYAKPPVGPLRWLPPEPQPRWKGIRNATQFGPHCVQPASPFGVASSSEDCLYLNVYEPKPGPGEVRPLRKPVMVWFHGGSLLLGESDDYDPMRLVQQGVVVVTVNYRLGLLGFLGHPALSAESGYGGSGNYGIMDQQRALEWVQRNIEVFGGDPRNVTIFGQSAGGLSVHVHLVSPRSAGLFHRAIVQSGAYDELSQPTLAELESFGTSIASALGCSDQSAACLRSRSVASLLAMQNAGGGFTPSLDSRVLTQTTGEAIAGGSFQRVPILAGSTRDEYRLFVARRSGELNGSVPIPPAAYPAWVAITLRIGLPAATEIADTIYPLSAYPSPSVALGALGTDAFFACNGRSALRLLSQYVPTWAYEFADANAPNPYLPPVSFPYGAYHVADVQYLFGISNTPLPSPGFTPAQQALSTTMVRYWTEFAKRGDPNHAQAPVWPAYTPASDTYQSLAPNAVQPITDFAANHLCDDWTP